MNLPPDLDIDHSVHYNVKPPLMISPIDGILLVMQMMTFGIMMIIARRRIMKKWRVRSNNKVY